MDRLHRRKGDEYLEQDRPAVGPNDGRGYKMTTMGDEGGMGASGLGGNQREGYPDGISAEEKKEHKVNNSIPTDPAI